jgi:hypothetical protein
MASKGTQKLTEKPQSPVDLYLERLNEVVRRENGLNTITMVGLEDKRDEFGKEVS